MDLKQPSIVSKPMEHMSHEEWESLCDGCGLCCQIRLEDEDTKEVILSNIACRYLCHTSHACLDYAKRAHNVADCVSITPDNVKALDWLPSSCAYRLVAFGYDLPDWHYLVCGDKNRVHEEGISMRGEVVSEDDVDPSIFET